MLEYRPFQAEHLRYLVPQKEQEEDLAMILASDYGQIMEDSLSLSGWDGNVCIGAAGCVPIFKHRAVAWVLLSSSARPFMLQIVRKLRRSIATLPYRRLEMAVREEFKEGHRLAQLLGMKCETPEPMQGHGAKGEAEMMYALVRDGST